MPGDGRALESALFDSLPVGVCLVAADWRIVLWSRRLELWTGLDRGEVVGGRLFERFPHLVAPRFRDRLSGVLGGGPPVVFSPELHTALFPGVLPDRTFRRQRVTATSLRPDPAAAMLLAVEDLTEGAKQVAAIAELRAEALREVEERRRVERERERLIEELRGALGSIKVLRGLIPICASCKKVRSDEGYWQSVESYVRRHTEADFSHGMCPECLARESARLDAEAAAGAGPDTGGPLDPRS